MEKSMDPKTQKCLLDCNKCYQTCVQTLNHCLQMGGKHIEEKHLNLLQDCALICKASENFMLRNSEHVGCLCDECAEICRDCAESCEKIDPNDTSMQECAKMCRQCAESCEAM